MRILRKIFVFVFAGFFLLSSSAACSINVDNRNINSIGSIILGFSDVCDILNLKLSSGDYYITAPIIIDGEGIGGRLKNINIVSDGLVNFYGGEKFISNSWAGLHEILIDRKNIYDVYVDGVRFVNSRMPSKNGFYYITSKEKDVYKKKYIDMSVVSNFSSDIDVSGSVIYMYHAWETSVHIARVDKNLIYLNPQPRQNISKWVGTQRFFIEGLEAGFDEDGEWFFDKKNKLLKINNKLNKIEVFVPRVKSFFEIKKIKSAALRINGIKFKYNGRIDSEDVGYAGEQAATDIGAAINIYESRNVEISNCEFGELYSSAIYVKDNSSNINIDKNKIFDVGAGGVYFQSGSGDSRITNNLIEKIGMIYEGAVGIYIGDSGGNFIYKNKISETGYTGISVGRVWGYYASRAANNSIVSNVISGVGRGRLSDMGGIYFLGSGKNSVVTGNIVDGVHAYNDYAWGAWGIYLDEGSSFFVVKNNFVINTDSAPIHLHYGESNVVSNNVFHEGGDGSFFRKSRKDGKFGLIFYNNTFVDKSGRKLFDINPSVYGNGSGRDDVLFLK